MLKLTVEAVDKCAVVNQVFQKNFNFAYIIVFLSWNKDWININVKLKFLKK